VGYSARAYDASLVTIVIKLSLALKTPTRSPESRLHVFRHGVIEVQIGKGAAINALRGALAE